MAKRPNTSQSLHDACLAEATDRFIENFSVYTNPGSDHNFPVRLPGGETGYPDIVACDKGTKVPSCIAEIETVESVTADERDEQWVPYARALKADLRLFVPKESLKVVQDLIGGRTGIRLRTWIRNSDGSFTFVDID